MKKINLSTILLVGAFLFLAYKLTRRYLLKPSMKFETAMLVDIATNDSLTIKSLRGQVVMVSCFQTWCADCARETADLDELAELLQSPQFLILYISDESPEKMQTFKKRFASRHIRYTHTNQPLKNWGIHAYPTTFLLNKKGEVVETKQEGYHWSANAATLQSLLAE
jgi:thiol-disulfide isomerase/thioredoxin